jgi:hypothetical protein
MPTSTSISINIYNTITDGYDFLFGNPQTAIVEPGVVVASTNADGVGTFIDNVTLVNFGLIFSNSMTGVSFFSNDKIENELGAVISGDFYGIGLSASNDIIDNLGSVLGSFEGVIFGAGGSNSKINNHGFIFGQSLSGVDDASVAGSVISNFGLIGSDLYGIRIRTSGPGLTIISNDAKGLIEGKNDAIFIGNPGDTISLNNRGAIVGIVDCTVGGDSVIVNHGKIDGEVLLGGGNDLFNGKGGTSGAIVCGAGNDRVVGGKGKVFIHVGTGNDTLTAGPGHDNFIFDSGLAGQVDTITNFRHRVDKILLSETDFLGIGPINHRLAAADFHIGTHATTASQHIIYDPSTGFLYYDPDGSGAMPQIHFATIGTHLQHNDLLVEA